MADNIGTLAARIVADASGYYKTMYYVKKSAASGAGAVEKSLAMKGKKNDDVDNISGGIQELLTAIPLVGSLLGEIPAAGVGAFNLLRSGLQDVKEMDREARKMGMTIEEVGGLSRAAGGDAEGFVKGIVHMRKELS